MEMLAKVSEALQRFFGPCVEQIGQRTTIIQRKRQFSAVSLAATFVLGHLWKPKASIDQLAQVAIQVGAKVTPQAVDQRRTAKLVTFLEQVFRESLKFVITSPQSLAPLLERFTSVTLIDSSIIMLPDSEKEKFAGCGGPYRSGQSALKLQTELDLRTGALSHIEIEQGKSPDKGTSRQHVRRGAGSLRITDLGYFNIPVFTIMVSAAEYFLSRLQFGTGVLLPDGTSLKLLSWLQSQPRGFVDQPIRLGLKDRLPCRLIAWRVPIEQANRRRQKLREEMKRKNRKQPDAERLAWCDWSILVTNVPPELLTPPEAAVLYRARWQIELLFKRWKSCGLVGTLTGSTDVHTMIALWSRLTACVIQHWLLVVSMSGAPCVSMYKASQAIRNFALRIIATFNDATQFRNVMTVLRHTVEKTCRRDKRKKTGTFELLNNPALLDFCLT